MDGYHSWMVRHKEVMESLRTQSATVGISPDFPSASATHDNHKVTLSPQAQGEPVSSPLLVRTPSIDVYAPTGISVLHSTDPAANPEIIRSVAERGLPKKQSSNEVRPTLAEALQMFPKLQPAGVRADEYVLFALTCPEKRCDAQRRAIEELHGKPGWKGLKIIEVNLH
jgi:hypothetical protein